MCRRCTFSFCSLILAGIIFHAQTMKQSIYEKSLKNYENQFTPYYVKEIVPEAVKRKEFKPEVVDHLGSESAANLGGLGKIRTRTSAGKYVVEFLCKTTIHGLNHLAAPYRHSVERVLTVLFLGVALGWLIALSLSSWYQYQTNPTSMVVDFDSANFNITRPATTVCLHNKVAADKFPEVFKKFGVEDTQKARNFFQFISNPSYETLNQTPIYNDTSPEKWLEILRDLYVSVDQDACAGQKSECKDFNASVTTDIVTEKGMCTVMYGAYGDYSSVDYWLSDNWTVLPQRSLPVYTYVFRNQRISLSQIPGPYEESISLQFPTIRNKSLLMYYTCMRKNEKITFHHPNELPQFGDSWNSNVMSGVVTITIDMMEVESTDYVKKLSKTQRTCNYPEDGKLNMWPVYTRNMCVLECRYNLFKSTCGCYPYFARPMPGVPVCNATQLRCIGNLAKIAVSLEKQGVNLCTCRDSCDTTRYRIISVQRTNIDETLLHQGDKVFVNTRTMNLDIQFPYFKLRHEVFFGFNEFLVSVGGAAGLFLGASIISFVEILYYVTLKLFWYKSNIYKKR